MRATIMDLRRNPAKVLEAVERNETVTISRRGKDVAQIVPIEKEQKASILDSGAIGMWKDREDMKDPVAYVQKMRRSRYLDL